VLYKIPKRVRKGINNSMWMNFTRKIKRALKRTWLHPRYLSNKAIHTALRPLVPQAHGTLLDIGCGRKPYKLLFKPYITRHIGIDVPSTMHGREEIDIAGSALRLPVADNSFDTVLATEVMEHVPEPAYMLSEIFRILRPGGTLILSVPFHEPLHELPNDFYRYTNISVAYLMEKQGFQVREVYRRGGVILVLCHLFCSYIYRRFGSTGYPTEMKTRPVLGMTVIAICLIIQIICSFLDTVFYDEFDTLGFVVLATKADGAVSSQ
jgi:SAM-dependent methyltransferase